MIVMYEWIYLQGCLPFMPPQLVDHEAFARKTAAAISLALSVSEYVYNQPETSEESRQAYTT